MSNNNIAMDPFAPPLAAELCETFFFEREEIPGVYSALFAFSTCFMLRKGLSNRTRNAMLAVSVVMYAVSASHWALEMAVTLRQSTVGKILITPSEAVFLIYSPAINAILGDSIVLWRAWVLWNRRFILFILPLIFILSTLVTSVASAAFAYEGLTTKSVLKMNKSFTLKWFMGGLTIGTNLWATCLIFIRAWQHRRFLRSQFGKESATTKAESTLAFLVESGALYLCVWLTFLILTVVRLPAVLLFRTIIIQITSIYPTAIFVVVTMRMSTADILGAETHHHRSTMIFVHPSPAAQPPILAMTTGSSSDSDSFVGSCEDRSTRTLESSDPKKGGKIVLAGFVS
ncbi:hypothetical protein BJV78DRAFT_1352418 [Lactifluus subvellereus]|nr:hypothetical protein BJV78DRAFT_1352418 [Lactifluus subvellereus]